MNQVERKLAAILYADIVGYSRLMTQDEEGTHEVRRACMETVDALTSEHGGRVFNTAGDAVLAEFPSVVSALACALEIQQALAGHDDPGDAGKRLQLRIGVNLGDVIVEGDNLYGHGVNIAARLESLAKPGGVCVPHKVVDEVGGKLPVRYIFLGEQHVKNIDTAVSAYAVEHDHDHPGRVITDTGKAALPAVAPAARFKYVTVVLALLLLLIGGIGYFTARDNAPEPVPAKQAASAPVHTEKPSIAILPFNNISADPAQEYFADGMTEDLITDLSKISGLFVIARNSSFAYKGTSPDIREVASELGVRYVLEGSVRKVGNEVRINAQLIDGETGGHLWADRYDGTYDDVFALQDKVTRSIVTTLSIQLMPGEESRLEQRETLTTEAYDAYLKGMEHLLQERPENYRMAIQHFEKATELDPQYSRAYAALSATYWQAWKRFWHDELSFNGPHDIRFKAEELLAMAMERPVSLAYQTSASMLARQGEYDLAISEGERAVALDPNSADGYIALAETLNLAGKPIEAKKFINRAMRLNPNYPTSYIYELGLAHFLLEEYEEAADALEQAIALNPQDRWSARLLIATLGHLDRAQDAEALMRQVENNWRGFDPLSIRSIAFWYPFKLKSDQERLAEGLRKAGVPD